MVFKNILNEILINWDQQESSPDTGILKTNDVIDKISKIPTKGEIKRIIETGLDGSGERAFLKEYKDKWTVPEEDPELILLPRDIEKIFYLFGILYKYTGDIYKERWKYRVLFPNGYLAEFYDKTDDYNKIVGPGVNISSRAKYNSKIFVTCIEIYRGDRDTKDCYSIYFKDEYIKQSEQLTGFTKSGQARRNYIDWELKHMSDNQEREFLKDRCPYSSDDRTWNDIRNLKTLFSDGLDLLAEYIHEVLKVYEEYNPDLLTFKMNRK